MEENFVNKGELKCEFLTHNLDNLTNFWLRKSLGKVNPDEPIPAFLFSTPENVSDGWYWFVLDGYKFTHCYVEVIGWTENTICQAKVYHIEKV